MQVQPDVNEIEQKTYSPVGERRCVIHDLRESVWESVNTLKIKAQRQSHNYRC